MSKLGLYFFLIITLSACFSSPTKDIPYKSDFDSLNDWSLGADAKIDKKQKAIKLSNSGQTWITSDRLESNFLLAIKPNKTYTISFKSKTSTWPPPLLEVSGAYYDDSSSISNSLGTLTANSKIDTWEQSDVYIDVPNNQEIKQFKIKIIDAPKKGINGDIWIKDITFKEGIHTHKTDKKPFDGSVTKIDKLGNVSIKKNGKFESFFPIGIYTDEKRSNWDIYQKQGFNIAMWTDSAGAIRKAKRAGLYSSMQLVQYIMPTDPNWIPQTHDKKISHLKEKLKEIKSQNLTSNLLFYYIDNEFYHSDKRYTEIIDIVINQDIDTFGNRMHPIYMLSGNYGLARNYNKHIDFTGTYVAEDHYDTDRTNALTILNETHNQTQPAIIAQINRGVGKNFRAILFAAIAKGARGMAYWRDGGSVGDIANRPWWNTLPTISKEIKQMMPLIRSNHKTKWSITTNESKIIYGTRFVNNQGYVIISNPTYKERKTIFKIENLTYKPTTVNDYFTNKTITKVTDNSFEINIPAHGSKVIKLVK